MSAAGGIVGDISARAPWLKLTLTVMPAAFLMNIDKQVIVILAPMIQKEFELDLVTITQILAVGAWRRDRRSHFNRSDPSIRRAVKRGPDHAIGRSRGG